MTEAQANRTTIAPWIPVNDGSRAVEYYTRAFGAVERYRLDDEETGRVIVAQLAIDQAEFWVQEDPDIDQARTGGLIRMIVTVDDPDAVFTKAISAGGTEVATVSEDHGWRVGRFVDPFGHHWEVGRPLA
ncbi:VOC family protein [Solihabitans fulvus]|uniref:VOC family protein n=1 Tax=Solihabitans fulvus TaxID=1892852 RepID=A0A5B2XSF9_9PSEU|nr:VOC family protein [Solihabitans fulvus]KAA2265824.1 VOC family protein [Solihabitans fulvus]